jgi:hypothetical protein
MTDFMGYGPTTFSRRFRWTFEANINEYVIPPIFVKVNQRPEMTFEEIEEDGIKKIVEGSQKWKPVEMIIFDVTNQDFRRMNSLWTFTGSLFKEGVFRVVKGEITFKLWDGVGNLLETWVLNAAHLTKVEFLDDYPGTDACHIQFTIEYDNVEYKNNFTPSVPKGGIRVTSASGHQIVMNDHLAEPKIPAEIIPVEFNNIIITDRIVPSESTTGYINISGEIPKEIKVTSEGIPEKITIEVPVPEINIPDITIPPFDPDMKLPPIIFTQLYFTEEELAKIKCKPIVPFPPDKHV